MRSTGNIRLDLTGILVNGTQVRMRYVRLRDADSDEDRLCSNVSVSCASSSPQLLFASISQHSQHGPWMSTGRM